MCGRCFLLMLLTDRFHERCRTHFFRTLPALFFSLTPSPSSKLWTRSQECWVTPAGRQPLGSIHAYPFPCISQYLHVEAIMLYWTEFHGLLMLGSAQQSSLSAHRNVLERIIDFCTPCSLGCAQFYLWSREWIGPLSMHSCLSV